MSSENELQQMLETSVVALLNKVQNDSWSLLIFQTLLWSFRRWAIHYLMSSEPADSMKDYIWDSHLDLVRQFAPAELKDFGIIWLNPANVGDRIDTLEELNQYFLNVVDRLDSAIKNDNEKEQNILAIFLDDRLTELVDTWLNGKEAYRIYPKADQSPDTFSPVRIYEIMRQIMDEPPPVQKVEDVPKVEPVQPVEAVEPVQPVEQIAPVAAAVPVPEEPPLPPPETLKEALERRRSTRKNRPKGAPKTRKRRAQKSV